MAFLSYRKIINTYSRISKLPILNRNISVAVTEDSSVVAFWHPEKSFPYEFSCPVSAGGNSGVTSTQLEESTVLKVQSSKELLSILFPKNEHIVRGELMKLTYTVKHIWFPPKFRFRRKKKILMDRPFL